MSGEERDFITKNEHNDKLAEKRLISAWAENQWPVELTQKLFDVHGRWLDQDTRQEFESQLDDISSDLENLEQNFTTENNGYDTEAIRSLDIKERKRLSEELYENTEDALEIFDQIYNRVQGHYDIRAELPDIIDNSVRNTFQQLIDDRDFSGGDVEVSVTTEVGDETLDQIYQRVEQSIEDNLRDIIDDDALEEVYDRLDTLEDEVVSQHEQTRSHTGKQHVETRNYTSSEHGQTRTELHDRADTLDDASQRIFESSQDTYHEARMAREAAEENGGLTRRQYLGIVAAAGGSAAAGGVIGGFEGGFLGGLFSGLFGRDDEPAPSDGGTVPKQSFELADSELRHAASNYLEDNDTANDDYGHLLNVMADNPGDGAEVFYEDGNPRIRSIDGVVEQDLPQNLASYLETNYREA